MKIKLTGNTGTMTRVNPTEDCDNYWIGVKPSDSTVFDDILMGDSTVTIHNFDFDVSGGRDRARRGLK